MATPAPIDDDAALDHLRDLIARHTRRLRILERKAATLGPINCPPEIEMEIEDTHVQITELRRRANALAEQIRIQRRRLILIRGSHIDVARLLRFLSTADFKDSCDVLMVFTDEDVLTIARRWPMELLIIDMPVQDQQNTLQFVKTFKTQVPKAKVILIVAMYSKEFKGQAQQHGVDYLCLKPFSIPELGGVMRQALGLEAPAPS